MRSGPGPHHKILFAPGDGGHRGFAITIAKNLAVAPLPVFVIQSSGDQFIPNEEAESLFVQTKRPKHFSLIHANNHSFEGNRNGFFIALQKGLQWIGCDGKASQVCWQGPQPPPNE